MIDMGTLSSKLESSPLLALFAAPLASFVLWNLWCYIRSPIGEYPGPFLASKNQRMPKNQSPSPVMFPPPYSAITGDAVLRAQTTTLTSNTSLFLPSP